MDVSAAEEIEAAARHWASLTEIADTAPPAEFFDPLDLSGMEEGVIEEALVESDSEPGKWYRLIRTNNGWQHYDTDCMGYLMYGHCHHIKEKEMESGLVPATGQALALIEEAEDADIIAAIGGKIVETWVYTFQQGGQTVVGISSKGVEAAARELAKEGEAIREIDCVLTFEDESEARFLAKAGRYAVHADGREILLDVAVRGKRVSKAMRLQNGGTRQDDSWYEKGITKAVRNAKLALLPESVQSLIIAEAAKQGRSRNLGPRQQVQPPRQAQRAVEAPTPAAECEHVATFDEKSTLMVCGKCGVVLEDGPPSSAKQGALVQ